MITQDLFNKKPKTFMDYEPGKVPGKNEWTSQTTTQTQPQNAFASNVKIVGDNVTEKEYDEFFKGFNSADDNPLWQEKQVQEEPKMQKLPYRPMGEGGAKISFYSGATPTYTQAKNTSQRTEETLWDKVKEHGEDMHNFWDELVRIYDDLSPETHSVMKTILNPLSDRESRKEAGKVLENEIKKIHYGRNQYNVDLPKNKGQAEVWDWETELANCHQFTAPNGERYIKYVSPDGKREVIFDHTGKIVIAADEDMGTYNYADPDLGLAHGIVDWLPWVLYGNTPEDTTEWYERLGRSLKFGK